MNLITFRNPEGLWPLSRFQSTANNNEDRQALRQSSRTIGKCRPHAREFSLVSPREMAQKIGLPGESEACIDVRSVDLANRGGASV
jgi:hypothetical protein